MDVLTGSHLAAGVSLPTALESRVKLSSRGVWQGNERFRWLHPGGTVSLGRLDEIGSAFP